MINKQFTSAQLRRWADNCATEAFNGRSSEADIARLWKINTALHQLAKNQDWFEEQEHGLLVEFVLLREESATG